MWQFIETAFKYFGSQLQLTVLSIIVGAFLIRRWRSRTDSSKRFLITNPPQDTVILHQFGQGSTVPSISPFVMKLETYLRVAKIPYINKHSRQPGPKGKLPWIQYNNMVVSDSQFCIQFLNSERNVDLNKHLNSDQVSIGHLMRRTAEESLYWALVVWRLVFEKSGVVYKKLGLPSAIIWYLRRKARSALWTHGIGRHSKEEVTQIMEDDLRAISHILGDKKFLFGNNESDVTEFDCDLFGQLCQLIWQMPGTPVQEDIAEKFPNLVAFCENMKTAFWSDWNERILHPTGHAQVKKPLTKSESSESFPTIKLMDPPKKFKVLRGPVKSEVTKSCQEQNITSFSTSQVSLPANEQMDNTRTKNQTFQNESKTSLKVPRKATSFTFPNLSFGNKEVLSTLTEDLTSSVVKPYLSKRLSFSETAMTTFRSRTRSASAILANNATILPAQ